MYKFLKKISLPEVKRLHIQKHTFFKKNLSKLWKIAEFIFLTEKIHLNLTSYEYEFETETFG